jgi:phosphatidylglycerophosphate synthase
MIKTQRISAFFHNFAITDAKESASGAPTYDTFWESRGRQSFWLTRNFGYRIGAYLALVAYRLGLKPAMLTALSLITTFAACIAALSIESPFLAGAVLLIGLLLGYCFDCADGPLARVTGRASLFGALLDKSADAICALSIPLLLSTSVAPAGDATTFALLLVLAIVPRSVLMIALWLKEAHTNGANRETEDIRPRNRLWSLRRGLGNSTDEVCYRTILAVAWAFGFFWSAIMIYGVFHLALLFGYFTVLYREHGPNAPKNASV